MNSDSSAGYNGSESTPAAWLLAAIVESSEDAIVSVHLDSTITSWNRAAEHLYGWTAAEALGQSMSITVPEARREEFPTMLARIAQGERTHFETTRTRKDGSEVQLSMALSPIRSSDGLVVGGSAIVHDITERVRRENELSASRALLQRAERIGLIGGWTSGISPNAPGVWTREMFRIFGVAERSSVTTADFFDRLHPDDIARVRATQREAITRGEDRFEFECRIVRPDGTQRWVFVAADIVVDEGNAPIEMSGVVRDISDRHDAEEKAREVEGHLRLLAESSPDLIFRYRLVPDPAFEFVSPASLAITGYTPDELYAQPELIDRLVDPTERANRQERILAGQVERASDVEFVRKDGSRIWVGQRLNSVRDKTGRVIGVDGIIRDISERKLAELRLEHEVLHDPLTGLPNRVLLMDRIEQGLQRSARIHAPITVLFLDLDRFKLFNDTGGHSRGDAVLVAVANRLVEHSRAEDTVGRFSGDEFVIICEGLRSPADAIKIAAHTLNSFAGPFQIDGEDVRVKASIGVATGEAGGHADELVRDADLAMYRAKEHGRARYEVFDETLRAEAERRSVLEEGLRRALDNDEFTLAYQPVWSITEGHFVGAEALLRWHDPQRGTIGPAEFIPIAEECGLIVPIGAWVLEQACTSLARWNQMGPRLANCTISVNISSLQLRSREFIRNLKDLIGATSIEPRLLCLEVTESMLMEDVVYFAGVLDELRTIGVRLSVDDFGTGYSSLSYLHRFPIDELKIDQSFVAGLDTDAYDATLVAAVIAIGGVLDCRVVAEGVETAEELVTLRNLGCQFVQGYLLARPCTFGECVEFLDAESTVR
jgi:diguanylate cyclase (GGDEF)-like protein/PAS domain S-box-containing protein